ncbi:MAG: polysaccharide deacetylase family protein [Paraglaciecola sp.]|nr:polysaccharide deacetylase family protein [Paraglaciecola sp.]
MFSSINKITLPPESKPLLQVIIDTEEEFDWSSPPDKNKNGVKHLLKIDRVQDIFKQYGIVPCYMVDYPVVSSETSSAILKSHFQAGHCEIGAHLQPWVNPPFEETLSVANMYPGNLPAALELNKLQLLTEKITAFMEKKPVAYKAGRYGIGPNTAKILHELGYLMDLSVCPGFDHRADGGPNYWQSDSLPFWFAEGKLLELPLTSGFIGWGGRFKKPLYKLGTKTPLLKTQAVMSRLGLVDRLMLSPEGYTPTEHQHLTNNLLEQGVRLFTWSFHSPSIEVGHTPYVQSERDLRVFLDSFKRYFDYFFGVLGGQAVSPAVLHEQFTRSRDLGI